MSRNGHGNALLLEITIVLFFFALSATIMLSMFLSAHDLSVSSRLMNRALFVAEDYAEGLCASKDPDAYLTSVGFEPGDERYRMATDQNLQISVQLSCDSAAAGLLWNAKVEVSNDQSVLAELPATWYVPDAVKEAA